MHFQVKGQTKKIKNSKYIIFISDLEYSKVNLLELNGIEILSVIMFLWAWSHQHVCTKILANLRKNKRGYLNILLL